MSCLKLRKRRVRTCIKCRDIIVKGHFCKPCKRKRENLHTRLRYKYDDKYRKRMIELSKTKHAGRVLKKKLHDKDLLMEFLEGEEDGNG